MAKLALCIKRADAPQSVIDAFNGNVGRVIEIDPSFWNTPVELVDRAICETNETWLQLLPYIAVGGARDTVFMYTRGGGGEEARLHGNYSIGVGGHVDVAPATVADLLNVICAEAAREIKEEISIDVPVTSLVPSHFICDPTNPVGRVHLGLLIGYKLPNEVAVDFANGLEAGSIENARMISHDDLAEPEVYDRLENWSKLVVDANEDSSLVDGSQANVADPDWDADLADTDGEDEPSCPDCEQPDGECECDEDECVHCGSHVDDCECEDL